MDKVDGATSLSDKDGMIAGERDSHLHGGFPLWNFMLSLDPGIKFCLDSNRP